MAYLSVKLDHLAYLRELRKNKTPDPVQGAVLAELSGADGITVHLRRDRRHIRERDLYLLKETARTRLTVEIALSEDCLSRVLEVKPYLVILVPEVEKELTSQSGLDINDQYEQIDETCNHLQEVGIKTGLMINPENDIIKKVTHLRPDAVKIYTGDYVNARTESEGLEEIEKIRKTARTAGKAGMLVMAGQGLDYQNIGPLITLGIIDEYIVGQAIIARSVLTGMEKAVRSMVDLVRRDLTDINL